MTYYNFVLERNADCVKSKSAVAESLSAGFCETFLFLSFFGDLILLETAFVARLQSS